MYREKLKNASGCESLDRTKANDVPQACGSEHASVTHTPKEIGSGQFETNVLMLNRGFANSDGNDIADHHHKGNLGGPGKSGWSYSQKRRKHATQQATPHLPILTAQDLLLVRVIHWLLWL